MSGKSQKPPRTTSAPWYAEGLRFECQPDCGACCTNHGDHTYLYLEEQDVERLARHLGMSVREFERRYTSVEDGWVVLRMDLQTCPFLEGTRCGVYAARPLQCRTFPFWKENLKSRASWEVLSEFCPGIGRGEKSSLLQIGRELALRKG